MLPGQLRLGIIGLTGTPAGESNEFLWGESSVTASRPCFSGTSGGLSQRQLPDDYGCHAVRIGSTTSSFDTGGSGRTLQS